MEPDKIKVYGDESYQGKYMVIGTIWYPDKVVGKPIPNSISGNSDCKNKKGRLPACPWGRIRRYPLIELYIKLAALSIQFWEQQSA